MTRDDIISMAQKAAAQHGHTIKATDEIVETLTSFYALAVAAEREACALLCEAMREKSRNSLFRSALTTAAGAIRARSSQAEKGGAS